jgi:hypothetical protein
VEQAGTSPHAAVPTPHALSVRTETAGANVSIFGDLEAAANGALGQFDTKFVDVDGCARLFFTQIQDDVK